MRWRPHIEIYRVFLLLALCSAVVSAGPAEDGRNRAVIIGIDGYDPSLGALDYCVADAKAVRDQLVRGGLFAARDVTLMTDDAPLESDRPSLARVSRRLANLSQRSGRLDTLVVFFSGHGVIGKDGGGYLIPLDGDRDFGLELSKVRGWLAAAKAKHRILILDACHAGQGAKGLTGLSPDLAAGAGLIVFASCKADQTSHEDKGSGHGVFSAYLAAGLSGKADADEDRAVTAQELFAYVSAGVEAWADERNLVQTPVRLPAEGRLAVPLARLPEPDVEIKIPEFTLPDEALPDFTLPDLKGSAFERVGQIKKLLDEKRAEIEEKGKLYAQDSAQIKALRAQKKALVEQIKQAVAEAVRPMKAELAAIERAWAEGERKGMLPAHREMEALWRAQQGVRGRLRQIALLLPAEERPEVGTIPEVAAWIPNSCHVQMMVSPRRLLDHPVLEPLVAGLLQGDGFRAFQAESVSSFGFDITGAERLYVGIHVPYDAVRQEFGGDPGMIGAVPGRHKWAQTRIKVASTKGVDKKVVGGLEFLVKGQDVCCGDKRGMVSFQGFPIPQIASLIRGHGETSALSTLL